MIEDTYEIYDSLSPYEVAVLAFTSPQAIDTEGAPNRLISITAKESYIWAGAVAHALIRNPELSNETIESALRYVIHNHMESEYYSELTAPSFTRFGNNYGNLITDFLRALDVPDKDEVYTRTQSAVRSLIWRGHIEDPFFKNIRNVLIGVVLVAPVGFTSIGPNELQIDGMTWQYVLSGNGDSQSRTLRVKVKEAADAVLNLLVPAMISSAEKLAATQNYKQPNATEIQTTLHNRGYYSGKIDGVIGPKTIGALRNFQRANYLEESGYLDKLTLKRLADSK